MAILKRTEKSMIRARCCVTSIEENDSLTDECGEC